MFIARGAGAGRHFSDLHNLMAVVSRASGTLGRLLAVITAAGATRSEELVAVGSGAGLAEVKEDS